MGGSDTFGWLEVELIGELLAERERARDPYRVGFTDLRAMVEAMPGFVADPEHPVNERILEEIQRHWIEALEDRPKDE